MKEKLYILFMIISGVANSQITFQKVYGGVGDEKGQSVQQTSDGGFIITGMTYNLSTFVQGIYLVKTAFDGTLGWAKTFNGGTGYGYSVRQTNDGGFIIGGTAYNDVFLIKTGLDGSLQWSKTFGGTGFEEGRSVWQTNDGGYIVGGITQSFGAGSTDIYLVKTNSDGALQWTKTLGGSFADEGNSIQQTKEGDFIIAGTTSSSILTTSMDIYLVKTNSDGNLLWVRTFGSASESENAHSVQQTTDGGFIICGGAGNYLVKTSSDGNWQWTKGYSPGMGSLGNSVQQTDDGGFISAGYANILIPPFNFEQYVTLVKTDFNGNSQWAKTFFAWVKYYNYGYSVVQTSDGGYVICGTTATSVLGGYDIYLIKTDSNGNTGCNEISYPGLLSSAVSIQGAGGVQGSGGIEGSPSTQVNSGGNLATLCFSNGINENELIDFVSVFPNPLSSSTVLQSDKFLKNATLSVYNSFGQQVKQMSNISGQAITLNRDNLSNGMYFIRLTQDGKTIATDKLIIIAD